MRYIKFFAFLILLLLPSGALKAESGEGISKISKEETIHGNVYEFGEAVVVEGVVDGDLFIFATKFEMNGEVKGDVIFIAERAEIGGVVHGNIRGAAEYLNMAGKVLGNTTVAAAKQFNLDSVGVIARNLDFYAKEGSVDGMIERDINGAGDNLIIAGLVGGNINYRGQLVLENRTRVGGDVTAFGFEPKIKEGAEVLGTLKFHLVPPAEEEGFFERYGIFWKFVWLFGMLVCGLLLAFLVPKALRQISQDIKKTPAKHLGIGIAVLVLTPVVAIILLFTTIGIPLAFLLILVYLMIWYLGKVIGAITLGFWIMELLRRGGNKKNKTKVNVVLAAIIGIIVFKALSLIPFFGLLLSFAAIVFGIGAIAIKKLEQIKRYQET